jgi:hypothetical protein
MSDAQGIGVCRAVKYGNDEGGLMRALSFGKLVLATIALAGLFLLSPPVAAANSITVDLMNGSLTGISQGTVVGTVKFNQTGANAVQVTITMNSAMESSSGGMAATSPLTVARR